MLFGHNYAQISAINSSYAEFEKRSGPSRSLVLVYRGFGIHGPEGPCSLRIPFGNFDGRPIGLAAGSTHLAMELPDMGTQQLASSLVYSRIKSVHFRFVISSPKRYARIV